MDVGVFLSLALFRKPLASLFSHKSFSWKELFLKAYHSGLWNGYSWTHAGHIFPKSQDRPKIKEVKIDVYFSTFYSMYYCIKRQMLDTKLKGKPRLPYPLWWITCE